MKRHDLFVTTPEARGGLAVKLPDSCRCGSDIARIGSPAGPHLAELRCTMCQQHRGWLPRAAHQFLTETINKFGRPDTPIAIRRGRSEPRASSSPPTARASAAAESETEEDRNGHQS
jgi:hypothetical protein